MGDEEVEETRDENCGDDNTNETILEEKLIEM